LISGKSIVSEWCTLIETAVGLELDLSLALAFPGRIEDRLKTFSALSMLDWSRTWSRLFNIARREFA
jgi:hypothetical protein